MSVVKLILRGLVDQDRLADHLGVRLQPGRQVDGVADAGVGGAALRAGVAGDDPAGGDADADADLSLPWAA